MWQFAPNGTLLPILLDCYEKNSSQWSFFWKKKPPLPTGMSMPPHQVGSAGLSEGNKNDS